MRMVNPERTAFIQKVLYNKAWKVSNKEYKNRIKTLTMSEVEKVMHDMRVGKTFMHTVNGVYVVDGAMEYSMTEYKL